MTPRKLRNALSGMILFASLSAAAFSQVVEKEGFDAYRLRIDAGFFYSDPTGSIHGASDTGSIDQAMVSTMLQRPPLDRFLHQSLSQAPTSVFT